MQNALAGVAQWIECWPENHRVTSSIPSQGTCLGGGCARGNHTWMFLSFLFSLPSPLSKNQIKSKRDLMKKKRLGPPSPCRAVSLSRWDRTCGLVGVKKRERKRGWASGTPGRGKGTHFGVWL